MLWKLIIFNELENVRILKEMRNQVIVKSIVRLPIYKNRYCRSKHIEDILFIRDNVGFGNLDKGLYEIAKLRIEHPEFIEGARYNVVTANR